MICGLVVVVVACFGLVSAVRHALQRAATELQQSALVYETCFRIARDVAIALVGFVKST